MWHKTEWMGHPMRLELTRVDLLVKVANHYTTKGALSVLDIDAWNHTTVCKLSALDESTWYHIPVYDWMTAK